MKLIDSLRRKKCNTVPVWMMRQAGRYLPEYREIRRKTNNFLDLCYNPELACEISLQPIRRYGFDAAILFSDILVVPDALGRNVIFTEGEGPRLDPIRAEDLGALSIRMETFLDKLSPVFEAVSLLRSKLSPDIALIGFCGAPWTVSSYMIAGSGSQDHICARTWAYSDPESFSHLIDILTEASILFLDAQVRSGVNAIQIFDTWSGILSVSQWRKWCKEPLEKIVAGLRKRHPELPVIAFHRGIGCSYLELVQSCKLDGLSLDTGFPLDFAKKELQPYATLQGNLDPVLLAVGGKVLDETVMEILETLAEEPFIFNLGHGILPKTPPENVARVISLVRDYSPTYTSKK